MAAETTRAYLQGLRAYVERFGRPVAFYSDRHSIFRKHDPEDPTPTQFERALRALDIAPILALSPQAKGRVECAFQTLQDRLVKALRLAGINTLDAANAFLPDFIARYNARFARPARQPQHAHRALQHSAKELFWIASEQHVRTLSKSLSCQYRGKTPDTGGTHLLMSPAPARALAHWLTRIHLGAPQVARRTGANPTPRSV